MKMRKRENKGKRKCLQKKEEGKKVRTPQNEKEVPCIANIHKDTKIDFDVERRYIAAPKIKASTENQLEPSVKKVIKLLEEQGTEQTARVKKVMEVVEEQATGQKPRVRKVIELVEE